MEVIKGRMYDYNNGRFLSVDPFIQSPTSTQSMNPYTYILNNPLSGTDPTGYRFGEPGAAGAKLGLILGVSTGLISEEGAAIIESSDSTLVGATDTGAAIKSAFATGSLAIGIELAKQRYNKRQQNIAKKNGNKNKKQGPKSTSSKSISNKESQKTVNVELNYKSNPKHDKNEVKRQAIEQGEGLEKQTAGQIKNNIETAGTKEAKLESTRAKTAFKKDNPQQKGENALHRADAVIGGSRSDISRNGDGGVNKSLGAQNKNQAGNVMNAVKDADSGAKVKVTVTLDDEKLK